MMRSRAHLTWGQQTMPSAGMPVVCVITVILWALFVVHPEASLAGLTPLMGSCPFQSGWSHLTPPEDPTLVQGAPGWGRVYAVAESRVPRRRLYVGGVNGLYRSDDCATTWYQYQSGLIPTNGYRTFFAITIDLTGRVFATTSPTLFGPLYRSDDGGETWTSMDVAGLRIVPATQGGLLYSPSGRLYVQTMSSASVRNGEAFAYSDDDGQSWTQTTRSQIHPSFAVDPNDPATIYAVNWPTRTPSPPSRPSPDSPTESARPTPQYRLLRSTDTGASYQDWAPVEELPGAMAVSIDASRYWLASFEEHLWQSRDKGQTWQMLDMMPFTDPKQIAVSPNDPRVLYAVSGDGNIWVYREPDPASSP
jgi:hypothetical protein